MSIRQNNEANYSHSYEDVTQHECLTDKKIS